MTLGTPWLYSATYRLALPTFLPLAEKTVGISYPPLKKSIDLKNQLMQK